MKSKQNRIARFIDSLPVESNFSKDCTSLLVTGMGATTTINSGNCVNYSMAECYGSTNMGSCRNATGECGCSTNNRDCNFIPTNNCPISPNALC